jgi:cytochrome c oxidase cbb3-type subunit 4
VLFIAVLGYALWPRNKDKFDHASRLPLSDEPPEDFGTGKKAPGARPTDKDQRS